MPGDESLTSRRLELALFFVKHKLLLRKILLGLLIAVDSALVGYGLLGISSDIFGIPARRRMDFELAHPHVGFEMFRETSKPKDLEFGGLSVIAVGDSRDVVMRLRNPNLQWAARFSYEIGLGQDIERAREGFLLPGEGRPFIATVRGAAGAPVFNVEEVRWMRISRHDIPDYPAWRDERIDFNVEHAEFLPSVVEGKGAVSRARITLENRSAYSYYEPKFLILLTRGSQLVGIQSTVVSRLRAGERREIEVSWFDRIGAVSNIEVIPEIDILNPEAYLKPEG